jgi:hypothetical protein
MTTFAASPRLLLTTIPASFDPTELLPVFNSNPQFLLASGLPPSLVLSDVQAYLREEIDRENSLSLLVRLQGMDHPIGTVALQVPNPSDGLPWIGLLILDQAHQRKGLATEAALVIEERLASRVGMPSSLTCSPGTRERTDSGEAWATRPLPRHETVSEGRLSVWRSASASCARLNSAEATRLSWQAQEDQLSRRHARSQPCKSTSSSPHPLRDRRYTSTTADPPRLPMGISGPLDPQSPLFGLSFRNMTIVSCPHH